MKLTIGIPTYNRKLALMKTVGDIIEQVESLGEDVELELIICDNASTDGTEELAKTIIANKKYANYYKNAHNLGFDGNCEKILFLSKGDYVWLLSDDDKLNESAVFSVYQAICKNKPCPYCFVNYNIETEGVIEKSRCKIEKDGIISADRFLAFSNFAFTFISSCIINRHTWLGYDFTKYIGTNWYHVFVARDLMINSNVLIIGDPIITMNGVDLITSRAEKRASYIGKCDFYIEAYLKLLDFANGMQDVGFGLEYSRAALKIVKNDVIRQVIYFKASVVAYDVKELIHILKSLSKYFKYSIFYWLICVPLLFSPQVIVGKLYWTAVPYYKKIKACIGKKKL